MKSSWIDWLMANGGPVVRYRTTVELLGQSANPNEVLSLPEVQRWLSLLGTGQVHHSKDSSAENCLAKLAEYGLRAGLPDLDAKAEPYCRPEACQTDYDYFILLPFLVRLGYGDRPAVQAWFQRRIDELYRTASFGSHEIYQDEAEKLSVPASLRDKRLYKAVFDRQYPLPSCYDFMTIAYGYHFYTTDQAKMDKILGYLMDGRFQTTPGGYIWDANKRRHYAAGRGYLATLPVTVDVPEWQASAEVQADGKGGVVYPDASRLVLFMEAAARLPSVRQSQWFLLHQEHLEQWKSGPGRYSFPSGYLLEKEGYYLYGGSHMGLAENRRKRGWVEIESTFRMVLIKSLHN